jgi:hypothetical protein
MVQPDCAGVIPFGPVSWYGVASPCADSGFAGTMMSQLTLAAAAAAVAVLVADVVGHGVADAEVVGAVVVVPVAAVVAVAVLEAAVVAVAVVAVGAVVAAAVLEAAVVAVGAVVAAAVLEAAVVGEAAPEAAAVVPDPWWPWPAVLAGTTYAAGEAQLAFAASETLFAPEWSTMATMAPTATTSATGMAIGSARRCSGPLDPRLADRCLLGMQSTSMSEGIFCVLSRSRVETVDLMRSA